jgi:hypothetical protein
MPDAKRMQAKTLRWKWRYRTPEEAPGPSIKAHGKFVTDRDPDGDGYAQILRIKGKRNGDKITGLYPAGTSIPGNSPYKGDNLIRYKKPFHGENEFPQLNTNGFQYTLADGSFSNVFFASFLAPPRYLDFHSVSPFPEGPIPPNSETAVVFRAWITS